MAFWSRMQQVFDLPLSRSVRWLHIALESPQLIYPFFYNIALSNLLIVIVFALKAFAV